MNKRTLSFIVAGVVVLAAGGLFAVKNTYESKVRSGIENFLANLPQPIEAKAGKIDISFFDKSVVISDLTVKDKGQDDVTFSVAKIAATGINFDAAKEGAGTTEIAKTLVVEKCVYSSKLFNSVIDSYAYQNISGDLNRMINESVNATPAIIAAFTDPEYPTSQKKQLEFLSKMTPLIAASETLTIGNAAIKNYTYTIPVNGSKMTVSLAEATVGKYSLREMGNMVFKDTTCSMDGSSIPFVRFESISMDSAELPSFEEMFKAISQGMKSPTVLRTTLQGQKFALKNLRVKNMSVRDPKNMEQMLFSLDNSTFSYVADSAHDVDTRFDGLKMAKALLAEGGMPEDALALMPETLVYSGAMRIKATARGEAGASYDLNCEKIAFKEDTLGEFSLSLAIDDLNSIALIMGMPGPAALKNFDLTVKDTGASNVLFTVKAAEGENQTAAALRAEAVKELPPQEQLPNDALRSLVGAVRTFIEKPGNTLRITLAPASPLNLQTLQSAALMTPDKLGLTASTTPAQ
jgi:hypothetical protein